MTTEVQWDDATLMAYADGEIDAATALQVETAANVDPQLAARIAEHVALRERVRQAYVKVVDEPVPDHLLAMLGASTSQPAPVSLDARRAQLAARIPARRWSWPEWSAMAASLVLGAFATLFLSRPQPLGVREGALVAQGALASALSAQLASTQTGSEPVQIGLSFRKRDGTYCRTFQFATTAGLACRQATDWRVEAVSAAAAIPAGKTFRTAAATLPPALLAAVEGTIDGDAFDAEGERAARGGGWQ
jgi:hypothetical protein